MQPALLLNELGDYELEYWQAYWQIEPFGYEWMKMSTKFPNVELWFQGYDPKKKEQDALQKEAELVALATGDPQPNPENVNSTPDPEGDISGHDDQYLSEEAAEAATFKVRDRTLQLKEAEKNWKALFGPKDQDDPYWKSLSDPNYVPPPPSSLPPKKPQPPPKKNTSRKVKTKSHDVEAVKAEFDRNLSERKMLEQELELEKLKTVATKFAKLGSGKKSMFGGKLARKSTPPQDSELT